MKDHLETRCSLCFSGDDLLIFLSCGHHICVPCAGKNSAEISGCGTPLYALRCSNCSKMTTLEKNQSSTIEAFILSNSGIASDEDGEHIDYEAIVPSSKGIEEDPIPHSLAKSSFLCDESSPECENDQIKKVIKNIRASVFELRKIESKISSLSSSLSNACDHFSRIFFHFSPDDLLKATQLAGSLWNFLQKSLPEFAIPIPLCNEILNFSRFLQKTANSIELKSTTTPSRKQEKTPNIEELQKKIQNLRTTRISEDFLTSGRLKRESTLPFSPFDSQKKRNSSPQENFHLDFFFKGHPSQGLNQKNLSMFNLEKGSLPSLEGSKETGFGASFVKTSLKSDFSSSSTKKEEKFKSKCLGELKLKKMERSPMNQDASSNLEAWNKLRMQKSKFDLVKYSNSKEGHKKSSSSFRQTTLILNWPF